MREFVYRPNTFEPLALLRNANAPPLHYLNDPNGCPIRLIDSAGQIQWAAHYQAWGAIAQLSINRVDNPIRLQGQYEDGESRLQYNRHRYYAPQIGAFISQDPLGLAAGVNVYDFAPSVLGWVDPLGLTGNCGADKAAKEAGAISKATSKIDRAAFGKERAAHWKGEAKANPSKYGAEDLARMEKGKAPIGPDGHSMELHHTDRTMEGGLQEMSRTEHRLGENFKKNHPD